MRAECCRPARRPLGVAVVGALLAVLVPKCPLCLAAYLSFLGAATGVAATGITWLRPVGLPLALAGLALVARGYAATRRSRPGEAFAVDEGFTPRPQARRPSQGLP
jgi:hypothetical protein